MNNLNIIRVLLTLADALLSEDIAGMKANTEEKQSLIDIQFLLTNLPIMVVDHINSVSTGEFIKGKPPKKDGENQMEYAMQRMKDRRGE